VLVNVKEQAETQIYTPGGCVQFAAEAGVADVPDMVARHLIEVGLATPAAESEVTIARLREVCGAGHGR